jgi:hypothetical protein
LFGWIGSQEERGSGGEEKEKGEEGIMIWHDVSSQAGVLIYVEAR